MSPSLLTSYAVYIQIAFLNGGSFLYYRDFHVFIDSLSLQIHRIYIFLYKQFSHFIASWRSSPEIFFYLHLIFIHVRFIYGVTCVHWICLLSNTMFAVSRAKSSARNNQYVVLLMEVECI